MKSLIGYSPISEAEDWKYRGFSPIPVKPGSKHPGFGRQNMREWSQFCLRQATSEEIRRWQLMDPRAGISLACGFGGLVGIDVDHIEAVSAARAVFGAIKAPSKIGRKGATAFFRDPTGKIATQRLKKPKNPDGSQETLIDILATGSQAIIPPTLHMDTGKPYRWHNQPLRELSITELPLIDEFMLMELRDRLAPILAKPSAPREGITIRVDPSSLTLGAQKRYQGLANATLSGLTSKLANHGKGNRNGDLYTFACFLAPFIRNGFLTQAEVETALAGACQTNGLIRDNGLPDVRDTITDAFKNATDQLPELAERERPQSRRAA
jgi:hypothetical protein